MLKRILIIGARGMLGQALAKVFSEEDLYLWDRKELDITNQKEVEGKITRLEPNLIINAAAYNDVDGAEEKTEIASLINGYTVGFLAKVAKNLGVTLIHYSTDYVFDGEKEEGYAETDFPNPISKYGESKFLGEEELQENCSQYYLIRLSRLFGPVGSGEGVKESFVDKMLELALTKKSLEIVDEEISCPTYSFDLANFTKYIVDSGQPFGVYHGANSGSCTWYELASETFKMENVAIELARVKSDRFPRPAKRPKYSILLNTKLPLQRSWQEALKEYLNDKKK